MFVPRIVHGVVRLAVAVVLAGAAPAAAQAPVSGLAAERLAASLALHTKLLCSGVFIEKRDPQAFIDQDLHAELYTFHDWSRTEVRVDRERGRVTLAYPGLAPRTARYTGDQGCVLLPQLADDVFFTPEPLVRPSSDDADRWPGPVPAAVPHTVRSALDSALAFALDDTRQAVPQRTRALLVVQGDRLIGEAYAPGFDRTSRHIAWSMGKSITGALVGILVGRGQLRVDDPAPVARWQRDGDPRRAITVADLLHMSSGLSFDSYNVGDSAYYTSRHHHEYVYFGAVDVFDFVLNRPLAAPPGSQWAYRNVNTLALGYLIRQTVEAHGEPYLAFPQRALFDPIGARDMVLETDPYGNFIMTGFVYGTAIDWARFGLLHLRDGVWKGRRILPPGWVDFVRTPAPAHPSRGYGAQFWLNAGGRYPRWPRDAYWALGWLGSDGTGDPLP